MAEVNTKSTTALRAGGQMPSAGTGMKKKTPLEEMVLLCRGQGTPSHGETKKLVNKVEWRR